MTPELHQIVVERLTSSDCPLEPGASELVLAACQSPDALAAALADTGPSRGPSPPASRSTSVGQRPAAAYVASLSVEGFRGIGPEVTLELTPGPGLTLIVGRNGSGKSSLAEGLEMLLTGENQRWAGRAKVWQEAWRNLHHTGVVALRTRLVTQGEPRPLSVTRTWPPDAALDGGVLTVQRHGAPATSLDALGWQQALVSNRPFLSYSELSSWLDHGPSKLFDALSAVLGLDALDDAAESLRQARLARKRLKKQASDSLKPLLAQLHRLEEDPRAGRCAAALEKRKWDLAAVEEVLAGETEGEGEGVLSTLRAAASLTPPDDEAVARASNALLEARDALDRVEGTSAEHDLQLAGLLTSALKLHEDHGDQDCPVCRQGRLDAGWQAAARERIAELRRRAAEAEGAQRGAVAAQRNARKLFGPLPAVAAEAAALGVDEGALREAWAAWLAAPVEGEGLLALAEHLEGRHPALVEATSAFASQAARELERRQDQWRPVARALRAWLPTALDAEVGTEQVGALDTAEKWLKSLVGKLRDERFEPIADDARAFWDLMRQRSNVELGRIELEGTGTRRRVALDVTVDGVSGVALGVMSQGELHALALSLFLPRASLDDSPFRFIVIDDPVQSMDPARVDGLARVLERVAARRQVVVLTHDDRLFEAVRRLEIDATVLEVVRAKRSVVEVRRALDPVRRSLGDARALAKSRGLDEGVARRLVPGFCRTALEAAFAERFRKRRLGAGAPVAEVDEALRDARKLYDVAALALFDDVTRGGHVLGRLNEIAGRFGGDVFKDCNEYTHASYPGDLRGLISDVERLIDRLERAV